MCQLIMKVNLYEVIELCFCFFVKCEMLKSVRLNLLLEGFFIFYFFLFLNTVGHPLRF